MKRVHTDVEQHFSYNWSFPGGACKAREICAGHKWIEWIVSVAGVEGRVCECQQRAFRLGPDALRACAYGGSKCSVSARSELNFTIRTRAGFVRLR